MPQTVGFLLDTNILVQLLRNNDLGQFLDQKYDLRSSLASSMISVVTIGEILSLGRNLNWGQPRLDELQKLVDELVRIEISSDAVLAAYAEIDDFSKRNGVTMGKNDIWIAATAHVTGATLITTDKDFDHLDGQFLSRVYVDPDNYR